jgi:hypothetical protein
MDPETRCLHLLIPGDPFDSVARARMPERGFLSRFHSMLADDDVTWSHRFQDGTNHIEFSLAYTRFWVEPKENGDG